MSLYDRALRIILPYVATGALTKTEPRIDFGYAIMSLDGAGNPRSIVKRMPNCDLVEIRERRPDGRWSRKVVLEGKITE